MAFPAASGGNGALTYSLSPTLPEGLSFSAGERRLAGTPTQVLAETQFTFRVTDGDGNTADSDTDSLSFSITVDDPPLRGTFAGRYQYLEERDQDFAASPDGDRWSETVWRGERAAAPLVILANDESPRQSLEFEMSDLEGAGNHRISGDQARILYPTYVTADRALRGCGGYATRDPADAVQLADALSTDPPSVALPGDPFKAWVEIDVPQDACPGDYEGHLTVRDPSDERVEVRLEVNLEVLAHDLPGPADWGFELDLWQHPEWVLGHHNDAHPEDPIERWSTQHYALLESSYRLLAEAGQKSITATLKDGALGAPGMVKWTRAQDEARPWEFDFSVFGGHVTQLMNWGISQRIDAYGIVGWNRDEIPYWSERLQASRALRAPAGSAAHAAAWRSFLAEFRSYLKERGWFGITHLAVDEAPDQLAALINLIHADSPDWKISLSYAADDLSEDLLEDVDTTNIFLGVADYAGLPRAEDKVRMIYTSCVYLQRAPITRLNLMLTRDSSPADVEWITWYADKLKQDGYSRWAYDYWQSPDPLDLTRGLAHTSGDYALIYRSSNDAGLEAMTSVRLETLRRGIQNFEKRRILRDLLSEHNDESNSTRLNALLSDDFIQPGSTAKDIIEAGMTRANERLDSISRDTASLVAAPGRCN